VRTPGRATVQGLGHFGGGVGVSRFLAREGWQVTVTDLQSEEELADSVASLEDVDLRLALGGHDQTDFTDTDLVVANPAVHPDNEYLCAARAANVPVVTEVGLFLERSPARVVAVTGTQGKSSTAHFLHQLLADACIPARIGGNIGGSLLDELPSMTPEEICVIELSSYQLDGLSNEVAETPLVLGVVTNLREDHLERHGTVEAYHTAKLELISLLAAGAPLLVGQGVVERARTLAPEATERVDLHESGGLLRVEGTSFTLRGELLGDTNGVNHLPDFQHENLLLALSAARLLGAPAALLAASLPTLSGLDHRLEDLGEIADRRVYDNGVSTTPDSTEAALESLSEGFTLIVGGEAKALPLDSLVRSAAARAKQVVLFGACAEEWSRSFRDAGSSCEVTSTVGDAVETAWSMTSPGDTLLFSPAAASFDAYRNFRERALDFRACVAARA
jgi:UDP-N-acetylmuramoylalanine--D-glutamate ligase